MKVGVGGGQKRFLSGQMKLCNQNVNTGVGQKCSEPKIDELHLLAGPETRRSRRVRLKS